MQTFDDFYREFTRAFRHEPRLFGSDPAGVVQWLRTKHEIIESVTAHNVLMLAQCERLHNENEDLNAEIAALLTATNGVDPLKYKTLHEETDDLLFKLQKVTADNTALINEAKALRAANDVLQVAFNDRSLASLPARDDPFSGKLKGLVDYALTPGVEPENISPEDALIQLYGKCSTDISIAKTKIINLQRELNEKSLSTKKLRKILKLTQKLLGREVDE